MSTATAATPNHRQSTVKRTGLAIAVVLFLMALSTVAGRISASPDAKPFTGTIVNISERNVVIQPSDSDEEIGGAFAYEQGVPLEIGSAVSGEVLSDPDLIYINTIND